ncbi:MAG: M23 family metallopeptidase [Flavobacteriales bacterium]|jgi:murein DD-endopeptidase MepM/ murein hydrolase activator NlpD
MKKIILPIIICLATLQLKALNFSDKDTVSVKVGDVFAKKSKALKPAGPLMVTSLAAFTDSVYSSIPDSMPFYDWITDDIHQKKFNFGNIQDTVVIVLNDSNDHYTPPVKGNITSKFGKRRWRYHYGTDIDLQTGDAVRSAFNGRIRISTYSKSYGHVVVVRHNNGLETLYAHLSKRLVKVDSVLSSGTVLGLGGNTGHSYGSHLHFEVRYFDEAIDPMDIISFESHKTHYDTLAISQCNFMYREELKLMNAIVWHRVRSGNTLGHIARKYGSSITKICRLNGISRTSILRLGQRLRVR